MKYFILLTVLVALFAATPVLALTSEDEMLAFRMGESFVHVNELYDAYWEGSTSVDIIQQTPAAAAAENQQATYNWYTSAGTFEVSSSDANDTGSVKITYLDSNWDRQTVTKTMTGQTAVAGGVNAIRILKAEYLTSGAQDTTNQGTIYVTGGASCTGTRSSGVPSTLSEVLCVIPIGAGVSKTCVFTTPRNIVRGAVRRVIAHTAEGVDFDVYLNIIDRTQTYPVVRKYGPFHAFQNVVDIPLNVSIGQKTDIYLTGQTGTAAQDGFFAFEVYYKRQ